MVTALAPTSVVAGSGGFVLTINGTNFVAASTVNFGGAAPATTFVSSTELTAMIPASSIASSGSVTVTVTNPAPGGGTSAPTNFTVASSIANTLPTVMAIFPNCVPAGEQFIDATDNLLSLAGGGFGSNSVVRWNGSDRPTTIDAINGLVAQIPASDIAAAGTAEITVFNSGSGGSSNAVPFTITPGSDNPQSVAIDPTGKFAYAATLGCGGTSGYVSMYTINSTTGALTSIAPPITTIGYSTDFGPVASSVAVDPSGKFVYVTNSGNIWDYDTYANGVLAMYSINATTGALTSIGSIIGNCQGLCLPTSVAVDPSGMFVYVANSGTYTGSVSIYTISSTTGNLTAAGTVSQSGSTNAVVVDPSGKFVYVATDTTTSADNLFMYTLDATTGALTSIGNAIAAGTNPVSVVTDPATKFVYVANFDSNDVSMYTINATTGALTSLGTIPAGTGPTSVTVDPTGKFAYVTNFGSNNISMYTIDATSGTLTSTGTISTASSPTFITVRLPGTFAYVTNSTSNEVSIYSIDATTGVLTLVSTIGT
jgi:DNA-binding beta-propeller fold protein YncE